MLKHNYFIVYYSVRGFFRSAFIDGASVCVPFDRDFLFAYFSSLHPDWDIIRIDFFKLLYFF